MKNQWFCPYSLHREANQTGLLVISTFRAAEWHHRTRPVLARPSSRFVYPPALLLSLFVRSRELALFLQDPSGGHVFITILFSFCSSCLLALSIGASFGLFSFFGKKAKTSALLSLSCAGRPRSKENTSGETGPAAAPGRHRRRPCWLCCVLFSPSRVR